MNDYDYEPLDEVLRLAEREQWIHPDATLGWLCERFVSPPAVGKEMTAYALETSDPSGDDISFMKQQIVECCLKLGSEMRLDTFPLYAAQWASCWSD